MIAYAVKTVVALEKSKFVGCAGIDDVVFLAEKRRADVGVIRHGVYAPPVAVVYQQTVVVGKNDPVVGSYVHAPVLRSASIFHI